MREGIVTDFAPVLDHPHAHVEIFLRIRGIDFFLGLLSSSSRSIGGLLSLLLLAFLLLLCLLG